MCGKRREMRKGNEKRKMRKMEDKRQSVAAEAVFVSISIMVLSGRLILRGNLGFM